MQSGVAVFVCVCVCVCVFWFQINCSSFVYLKSLARHAGGLERCSRDCSGALVVASLEETRWGTLVGPDGLAVASLKETRGVLWRFDSLYSCYITQGGAGGALAGCYEPTAQVLLYSYTLSGNGPTLTSTLKFLNPARSRNRAQ